MEIIKGDDFRRSLKKGLSGGYFFFGDEDYMKLHALDEARKSVCADESFSFFNDIRLDPVRFDASSLLDALAPLPMMSDKKVVSVSGLDMSAMKASELDDLYDVLSQLNEYDYNVLIISVTNDGFDEGYLPNKPSKAFSSITKHLCPVKFDMIAPARLGAWCEKHFLHNGVKCSPEVSSALVARVGSSMFALSAEIDKLSYYVLENMRDTVTIPDVEKVTCAALGGSAFALTNALLEGKREAALWALAVLKNQKEEPANILGEISRTITNISLVKAMLSDGKTPAEISSILTPKPFKINAYVTKSLYIPAAKNISKERLRRAVTLCAEADADVKRAMQGYTPIERLLCSL